MTKECNVRIQMEKKKFADRLNYKESVLVKKKEQEFIDFQKNMEDSFAEYKEKLRREKAAYEKALQEKYQDEYEYERKLLEEQMREQHKVKEEPDWVIVDGNFSIGMME